MVGLPPHRLLPVEPQPGEIAHRSPASNSGVQRVKVDVLDAQQQAAVHSLRAMSWLRKADRRVAEMQRAVRAWRETDKRAFRQAR